MIVWPRHTSVMTLFFVPVHPQRHLKIQSNSSDILPFGHCWMTTQETVLWARFRNGLLLLCSLTSHGWRSWTLAAPLQGTPVGSHSPAGSQTNTTSSPSTLASTSLSSLRTAVKTPRQLRSVNCVTSEVKMPFSSFPFHPSLLFLNKSWIVCEPSSNWVFGPRQK